MNKTGSIIIIEDDLDDQFVLTEVFREIGVKNEIHFFSDGGNALAFLDKSKDQPFLILSDVRLPKLNGFELREKLHNNEQLRLKCVPYLFFTTQTEHKRVIEAYSQSIQGFFVKPDNFEEIKSLMQLIIQYWGQCYAVNATP